MALNQRQFAFSIIALLAIAILSRGLIYDFNTSSLFSSVDYSLVVSLFIDKYEPLVDRYDVIIAMLLCFSLIRLPLFYFDYQLAKLLHLKEKLEPKLKSINQQYAIGSLRTLETLKLYKSHNYKPFLMLPFMVIKFGVPIFFFITVFSNYPLVEPSNLVSNGLPCLAVAGIFYVNLKRYRESVTAYQKVLPAISFVLLTLLAIFVLSEHILLFILIMQLANVAAEEACKKLSARYKVESFNYVKPA